MSTVLISGASTGIGRATALRLARSGWTVLAGVRDPAVGETLAAEEGVGGRLRALQLDVTDSAQIAQAAALVAEQTGGAGLDALIANAGVALGSPLELIPMEDLRRQFEVNFFGHVATIQALAPALRRARGRIVLVSSVGGRVTTPYAGPYCASKYALEAVGDALRVELHRSGIEVALMEPGSVATPIWEKGRTEVQRAEVPAELREQYGHVPAAMSKVISDTERRGIPPEQVAERIERALGARRMRARYLIGRDARVMVLMRRLMPDLVFDRVIRRVLGV